MRKGWIAPGLVAACGLALLAPAGAGTPEPPVVEFAFTGAPEEWPVPDGVCEMTIVASGAEGGVTHHDGRGPGLGGRAEATVAVQPGDVLTVDVGGQGADPDGPTGGAGGYPDGGDGGSADPGFSSGGGGGGGGSTQVRRGTDVLVVAGGGGGAGAGSSFGTGGGGGGGTGIDGFTSTSGAGGGASGGNGGAGGLGAGGGDDGDAGGPNQGGDGGDAQSDTLGEAGGGGGGGVVGGGGGGGNFAFNPNDGGSAAGGGGGGSGTTPDGTGMEDGVNAGDGSVLITTTPCDPIVGPDDDDPDVVPGRPSFTG